MPLELKTDVAVGPCQVPTSFPQLEPPLAGGFAAVAPPGVRGEARWGSVASLPEADLPCLPMVPPALPGSCEEPRAGTSAMAAMAATIRKRRMRPSTPGGAAAFLRLRGTVHFTPNRSPPLAHTDAMMRQPSPRFLQSASAASLASAMPLRAVIAQDAVE